MLVTQDTAPLCQRRASNVRRTRRDVRTWRRVHLRGRPAAPRPAMSAPAAQHAGSVSATRRPSSMTGRAVSGRTTDTLAAGHRTRPMAGAGVQPCPAERVAGHGGRPGLRWPR